MADMRRGYTLLELTMVLAVIALVAAGVLAARSLIRTSQIQAIAGEYQLYASAIKNFKAKYHAMPGDFSNATGIWGEVSSNCQYGTADGNKTCNGNGNSLIEFDNTNYEHIAAWRHLGLSGFINQNFTGNIITGGVCNIDIRAEENAPRSKLKGAVWNIGSNTSDVPYTTGAAGNQYFPMNVCNSLTTVHALWLGGGMQDDDGQAAGCSRSQIPVLTAYEAYSVDVKFDDKRAKSGKIRNQFNNTATYSTCEDSASSSGGYRVSANGLNCSLVFLIDP